jgi:hypothetical protein
LHLQCLGKVLFKFLLASLKTLPQKDWRQHRGSREPVMKSNTVTRFKIISSLRNSLKNHKRVPATSNKQFEESYWKDFLQLLSVFIEASQNFIFYFLHNKAAKKLKTIAAHTESTYLIFKTFKIIIHLGTQSL